MFVISCTSLYKLRNGLIAWHPISNYFATTQLHVVLNLVHIPDNFVSRGGVLYSQICVKYERSFRCVMNRCKKYLDHWFLNRQLLKCQSVLRLLPNLEFRKFPYGMVPKIDCNSGRWLIRKRFFITS